jgi:hypothetical protein
MALILNTLFQLGKTVNSVSISIIVIIYFVSDTTFLKFPITSFNVDYFLILIGLNLIRLIITNKKFLSLSQKFYLGSLIFAFSFAKIYSFGLILIWLILYLILTVIGRLKLKKDVLIPSILGLIPAFIWLLRNILFFKNPFYPYFDQVFNSDYSTSSLADPFGPDERFRFFELITNFELNLNSYILIYEFILVIVTLFFIFYLIKKYWRNFIILSFLTSSLLIYIYLYWSTGDELNRYRHFISWMTIYLLIMTLRTDRIRGFIITFMIISTLINFTVSRYSYIQNVENNLNRSNMSDQLSRIQTYDQFKLIQLAHTKYTDERVLLIGDNRLALLPINFRAADPSRFSVLNSFNYDTTEKIVTYVKKENFKVLMISFDWGEPAGWNKQLWFELFQNPQICDAYDFEGLLVCEIKY